MRQLAAGLALEFPGLQRSLLLNLGAGSLLPAGPDWTIEAGYVRCVSICEAGETPVLRLRGPGIE